MLISNCCGAKDKSYAPKELSNDNKFSDYEICPDCKEPCEFINEDEEEE